MTSPTAEAVRPPRRAATGGPICPSCETSLAPKAKICIQCGIYVPSGRPLLTSQGLDEDTVYVNAENVIKFVSWVIRLTPLPIPIASEAYGGRKPYTIWTIAALTCICSLAFFFYSRSGSDEDEIRGQNLMLWSPTRAADASHRLDQIIEKLRHDHPDEFAKADTKKLDATMERIRAKLAVPDDDPDAPQFHAYQLITHAFLHDIGSPFGFAMHLAGNLLFLLVFGSRVNALIGNIATAILYPILAIAAACAHMFIAHPIGPMLGASGAIMGLAGMYLVLFPVHRVFCAMWIRIRLYLGLKIFPVRGFWVLAIYFAYDIVMNWIEQKLSGGMGGGVAHWAHIGGFTTGMLIALVLLFSRLTNARGGDVLSVMLGRYAWPLIGKPARRASTTGTSTAPMAPPVPGLVVTRYPV